MTDTSLAHSPIAHDQPYGFVNTFLELKLVALVVFALEDVGYHPAGIARALQDHEVIEDPGPAARFSPNGLTERRRVVIVFDHLRSDPRVQIFSQAYREEPELRLV